MNCPRSMNCPRCGHDAYVGLKTVEGINLDGPAYSLEQKGSKDRSPKKVKPILAGKKRKTKTLTRTKSGQGMRKIRQKSASMP